MPKPNVLAVSYGFPPMASPQSIQVSRFVDMLGTSVAVVSGEDPMERRDETIAPGIEERVEGILRVPFHRSLFRRRMDGLGERLRLGWTSLPDPCRGWVYRAERRVESWQRETGFRPDLLITFGMPMSDHLFGLAYKRRTGCPWIAHFSDPWADNPFRRDNPFTAWLNRRMEGQVIAEADAVVFTSLETLDLVMRKYPGRWREKAFVIPHAFDRRRFDPALRPPEKPYVMRHIGSFYGPRSPQPLLAAIECLAQEEPGLLDGVAVEFIGSMGRYYDVSRRYPAAHRLLAFRSMVPYAESLRLMQTAHCLLVIDAPAEVSVFFPSKLVEYIGSNRFILALSPRGTTARVVEEVGGMVLNPDDGASLYNGLRKVLRERPWNLQTFHAARYDLDGVRGEVERLKREVLDRVAGRA